MKPRPHTRLRDFLRDENGLAALEASFLVGVFAMAAINAAELGRYTYVVTQVVASSQAGAQAAAVACGTERLPATLYCDQMSVAVSAAVRAGSLGSRVRVKGLPVEAWYCVNPAGDLAHVGPAASPPPESCEATNGGSAPPSLYIRVEAETVYTPMFPGLTLVERLPMGIQKAGWMRML